MEIKKAVYVISNADYKACPAPDRPEFAFIGRSNVGKSSLINMLCKNNKLAKTSSAPGKTQLINHFEIESNTKSNQGFKNGIWWIYLVMVLPKWLKVVEDVGSK